MKAKLEPPDLSPYRSGSMGVDYLLSFKGPREGPHVMAVAIVHGNELCGATAIDTLLNLGVRPTRGRLTFCFANIEAFFSFDPTRPLASRYLDQDFNRVWTARMLDSNSINRELRRARELRPVIDTVDYMIDLHSIRHDGAPLILSGMQERAKLLAREVGYPEWVVADRGHSEGGRLRDYDGFEEPDCAKTALLVECGPHFHPETGRRAVEVLVRFLHAVEVINKSFGRECVPERQMHQKFVKVTERYTACTDHFRFVNSYDGFEIVPRAGTIIAYDDDQAVRTPHDDCVIVMPSRNLTRGMTMVRFGQLVETGGPIQSNITEKDEKLL